MGAWSPEAPGGGTWGSWALGPQEEMEGFS